MKYLSLGTSDGLNQILKIDINNKSYFEIDSSENFTTEDFDIAKFCEIVISAETNGTGIFTYEKSIDRILWIAEKNEDNSDVFSLEVTENGTLNIVDQRGGFGWRRLVYTVGTATEGNFIIKVVSYE